MESISNWCHRFGVPGITGVDTRAITSLLRQQGSTLAKIAVGDGHQTPVYEMACEPSRSHLVGRDYSRREGVQPILLGGIPPDERVYNPSCWEESLPTRGCTTHLVGRNPSRRDGLKTSSSGGFPPDELDYVQVWQSKFAVY
ncbi:Multifunctional pyrimidine synthesis protein CAD [Puccinia graminis f. sp. tritici]|uniref:Multifunctional pyrimidine synthesis protein CAD n=1 Tax=Puccinia graminis f. sp. tritici TaxID=56615 RepID=A0A5B0RWE9_PUCGR|nr:Multifunctional pyrimidine synthesis protein CAD [Puccinia graminis f. sp. tritici]